MQTTIGVQMVFIFRSCTLLTFTWAYTFAAIAFKEGYTALWSAAAGSLCAPAEAG